MDAVSGHGDLVVLYCLAKRRRHEHVVVRATDLRPLVARVVPGWMHGPFAKTLRELADGIDQVLEFVIDWHAEAVEERLVMGNSSVRAQLLSAVISPGSKFDVILLCKMQRGVEYVLSPTISKAVPVQMGNAYASLERLLELCPELDRHIVCPRLRQEFCSVVDGASSPSR
nr:hypothetical protein [Arthrobacter sp. ISL-28]